MYNHGSERKKRNETEHNAKCKEDVHGLKIFGEMLNIPRSIVKCIRLNCFNLPFPYPCAFELAAKLMTNKRIRIITTTYSPLIVMMLLTPFPHHILDICKYLMILYVLC